MGTLFITNTSCLFGGLFGGKTNPKSWAQKGVYFFRIKPLSI